MKVSKNSAIKVFVFLLVVLIVSALISARYGAVNLKVETIFSALKKYFSGETPLTLNERIFLNIRLPRTLLCIFVGMGLAVGGTLLQGLFRNPIIEPGLIGTSSGAALGASLYFVFGSVFSFHVGQWTLPIVACLGGMLATLLVLFLSRSHQSGKNSTVTLLLVGIAVNALCLSGVGFLSYIARDPQARSITFWSMGSLAGANWSAVYIVGSITLIVTLISLRYTKHINALVMGEEEAMLVGVDIKRVKLSILLLNIVMISVATAFVGVISFVGLIVPHLLRITIGSDNRNLLIGSALLGGILLVVADLFARLLVAPAELPIGIITSLIGVPVFIILLRRNNYLF